MIVLYKGRRGAGKTLTMVKDAINFYKRGWTIYSNFDISIPYKKLTNDDILGLPENDNISDCVILLDEIQTIIDSRRSMKGDNLNFSYFIQQIRKKRIVLLATTQFTGTTDKRFREHVDVIVKPRIDFRYPIVKAEYFDMTSEEDFGFIKSRAVIYNPEQVFGFYDTNEIKKSNNTKKKKKEPIRKEVIR